MCTVGLIMGKSMLAKYSILGKKIPISHEVASVLANIVTSVHASSRAVDTHIAIPGDGRSMIRKNVFTALKRERKKLMTIPYGTTTYAVRQRGGYGSLWDGTVSVFLEFLYNLFNALCQSFLVPDRYARNYGKRLFDSVPSLRCQSIISHSFIIISDMFLLPSFQDVLAVCWE